MTSKKKIVVTGALGHIGSRLIRELPRALGDLEVVMDCAAEGPNCGSFTMQVPHPIAIFCEPFES